MSIRIQVPPQSAVATATAAGNETKAKDDAAKVARDFEAILVRQMLSSTKVAGKGGGYADMAVEALAASIASAGGLGMSHAIEQAISAAQRGARSMHSRPAPTPTDNGAPRPAADPTGTKKGEHTASSPARIRRSEEQE